jgi:hypothetical protein
LDETSFALLFTTLMMMTQVIKTGMIASGSVLKNTIVVTIPNQHPEESLISSCHLTRRALEENANPQFVTNCK